MNKRPNFYTFSDNPIAFYNPFSNFGNWVCIFEVWILWLRKMEEFEGVNCFSEGRSSSETRPPNPNPSIASAFRQCQRNDPLVLPCRKSLVRHASLVRNKSFVL